MKTTQKEAYINIVALLLPASELGSRNTVNAKNYIRLFWKDVPLKIGGWFLLHTSVTIDGSLLLWQLYQHFL